MSFNGIKTMSQRGIIKKTIDMIYSDATYRNYLKRKFNRHVTNENAWFNKYKAKKCVNCDTILLGGGNICVSCKWKNDYRRK